MEFEEAVTRKVQSFEALDATQSLKDYGWAADLRN